MATALITASLRQYVWLATPLAISCISSPELHHTHGGPGNSRAAENSNKQGQACPDLCMDCTLLCCAGHTSASTQTHKRHAPKHSSKLQQPMVATCLAPAQSCAAALWQSWARPTCTSVTVSPVPAVGGPSQLALCVKRSTGGHMSSSSSRCLGGQGRRLAGRSRPAEAARSSSHGTGSKRSSSSWHARH